MCTDKTKRIFISFIVLDILIAVTYGYFVYDLVQKAREVSDLYAENSRESSEQIKLRTLEKMTQASAQDSAIIDSYFVRLKDVVPFMEKLEEMGKSVNVSVDVTSIKNTSLSLNLAFSATGSFNDIYRLIALLESAPYKIVVKNVNMQSVENSWSATMEISLLSYINN